MDIFILVGCTVFAALVTFFLSFQKGLDYVNEGLRDENSVVY